MSTTILHGIFPWVLGRGPKDDEIRDRPRGGGQERWYRVKVDMNRLRSHLGPERASRVDERALRRWLRQSGFQQRGDWWVVREAGLGQLAPSEVAASEPMS